MVKQQLNLEDFYLTYLDHRPVIPHQLRHMNAYHMKEAFKYQKTKLKKTKKQKHPTISLHSSQHTKNTTLQTQTQPISADGSCH